MDIEAPDQLAEYLQARGLLPVGEEADMRVLAGGVSNKTVWLRRPEPPHWVLKQALPKLRVKDDWFSDPSRIHREAEGMRVLAGLAPAGVILPFVFEDEAAHILAMDAAPEPHTNWKSDLLAGVVEPSLVDAFGRILGQIHRRFDAATYPVDGRLRDRSFFESLRLAPYYQASADRAPEAAAFLEVLIRETRATAITVVHGDYSPKNVLVHAGRLILLDHEVIHIGDPAFDVGFSLTHFLSKAHHLPEYRTSFVDAARRHWAAYAGEARGAAWFDGMESRAVAHTLACLLARAVGRSPLEYLDPEERMRQRDAVVKLMGRPPAWVEGLIEGFLREIHI
ncbi:MAG: phosphotransferase [Rhodothermales bacterium]|nr:phosphotransferase [Rhodothermales bacterium]